MFVCCLRLFEAVVVVICCLLILMLLTSFFFLFALISSVSPSQYQIEREVLMNFYKSTTLNGNWLNSTGWFEFGSDHCSWFGITCDSNDYIVEIHMDNNKLSGSLPSCLNNLINLQNLTLKGNSLSGNIPASLSQLTDLKMVDLSGNRFTSFDKEFNSKNLHSLEWLDLSLNRLFSLSSTLQFKSLTYLNVESNQIKQIPEILEMESLKVINLNYNPFDYLPTNFWKLTNLASLQLDQNSLPKLPTEVGFLTSLSQISLQWNSFTDPDLPTEMALLPLQALELSTNKFQSISSFINQFTSLEFLGLAFNNISDLSLNLSTLTYLAIHENPLQEFNFENLPNLQTLKTSASKFVPTSFLGSHVTHLTLTQSTITTLPDLPISIEEIYFSDLNTVEWPKSYYTTDFSNLRFFQDINHEDFIPFPDWLTNATNTKEITLGGNFTGTIPTQLGLWTNLSSLNIFDAQHILGQLPTEFGLLTNLEIIKISGLGVNGNIPSELALLSSSLKDITIVSEGLEGELPPQISIFNNLTNCEFGPTENFTCVSQVEQGNFFGEHICNVICQGESLVGNWSNFDCTKLAEYNVVSSRGVILSFSPPNLFTSTFFLGSDCSSSDLIESISGNLVIDGVEVVDNESQSYVLNVTYHFSQKEMMLQSQLAISFINYVCGITYSISTVNNITDVDCPGPYIHSMSVSQCPSVRGQIFVNFTSSSMRVSESLIGISETCETEIQPYDNVPIMIRGWNCVFEDNSLNVDCVPICGDGIVISPETCDDGE